MIRKAHPLAAVAAVSVALSASSAFAATLSVGPGKTYAKPCDAGKDAKDGDTVEIDAAGSYAGDVCTWSQTNLTLKGVNGRPKLDATGTTIPNQKGIWVFYGDTATVENIEFVGASVPDANGAGIRHQGLNLTVRGCYFHDNQNGILGAPSKENEGVVLIERSEFAKNGAGDGQSHNMYLNHYARFTLQYSYSHSSNVGHLVKSRAVESHILYNRLSDDESTNVSYEINLPNGGKSYVIGNLVEQASDPNGEQNGGIIDYGSETAQPGSDLFVVNNTVVNNRAKGGTFVQINGSVVTPAVLRNNIFTGGGTVCNQASAVLDHNFTDDPKLVDAANHDYHLLTGSPCAEAGADPGMGDGMSLTPTLQYVHPTSFEKRSTVGTIDIGAYELGGGSSGSGGGTGVGGGAATTTTGGSGGSAATTTTGGAGGSGGSGGSAGAAGDDGGCGCSVVGDDSPGRAASALLVLAAALVVRRRRAS